MESIDLSEKIDRFFIDFYTSIEAVTNELGINYMVVGATARDHILELIHGVRPARATKDIDLGINIKSWEEFRLIREALIETGRFTATSTLQRLMYDDNFPVDIVPFGSVSEQDRTIAWPPDYEVVMNVAGFQEAYDSSLVITLSKEPYLEVKMVSLAGLFLLKVFAWRERNMAFNKDALDMAFIIKNYGSPVNEERLYELESALLEQEGYDLELAGARLLGRDVASIAGRELSATIQQLLDDNLLYDGAQKLLVHMSNSIIDGDFEKQYELVNKLNVGISEVVSI